MVQPVAETRPEPICGMNTWMPVPARILAVREENFNTRTFTLQFVDEEIRKMYRFAPGQFNMLYVPGVGEAAISISSDPSRTDTLDHTIRLVGSVTRAVERLGANGAGRAARPVRPRLAAGSHGRKRRGDRRRRHRAGPACGRSSIGSCSTAIITAAWCCSTAAAPRKTASSPSELEQWDAARLDPSPGHGGQRHRRPGPVPSAWSPACCGASR